MTQPASAFQKLCPSHLQCHAGLQSQGDTLFSTIPCDNKEILEKYIVLDIGLCDMFLVDPYF